jgi:hypothetical protein
MSAPAPAPRLGPPSLATTASVTTWGHLSWIPWFWFGGALVFGAVVVAVGIWGEMSTSVWEGITSWLAWVVFAAGVTTVTSYARSFVANGITRDRLSSSTIVSVVAIAVLGGLVAVVGYAVEDLVYGVHGWRQELRDGSVVDGVGSILGLGLGYLAVLPAYFASGWLVGLAWSRLPWVPFLLALVPALAPLALVELVVLPSGWLALEQLDDLSRLPLVLAALASVAVAAVAIVVARRLTRDLAIDP